MTSVTPLAIQVALTTASCSAEVRTWPVSLTALPKVSAATSLSSGIEGACDGDDQRDLPEPSGQGADALHYCPWVGARRNDREQQVCAAARLGAGPEIRAREDPAPAGGLAGCR